MVSYEHLRRSSRIPKELAILLTGSDMDGKGFSEMTKTVLLSRHGAGIISTYKLSAEQEVIVRYLDTNKEAYVAFVDPNTTDFWGIDFAPVSEREKDARRVLLECGSCKGRETVEHSDVESDVFLINEGIVRYCQQCGDSTLWKRALEALTEPAEGQPVLVAAGPVASVSSEATKATPTRVPRVPQPQQSIQTPSIPSSLGAHSFPSAQPTSAYASPTDRKAAVPLDNRRKHTRTKVTYKACIRRSGFTDDVVTCEDMSKGGLSFKSRKKYFERTAIEIAVPYSQGGNAIFVPAEIVWVVEITPDKLYKCGVAFRITSRPS
jgi:hypothetical protein